MNQNLRFLLCLVLSMGLWLPLMQAQELVNYEETWQEFLRNPKTSSISKLRKPDKGQVANYLKFSLMYATKYFCADDLTNAKRSISDIESMGSGAMDKVPGFEARFDDLKVKIKAYYQTDKQWQTYKANGAVSKDKLDGNEMATKVCEKGTLSKHFMMTTYDYYCKADLKNARDQFENRVLKLAKTSFNPAAVGGLKEDIDKFKKFFKGLTLLEKNWSTFIETDKSPGFDYDLPLIDCYPIPKMKAYMLKATTDVCQYGDEMLKKIKKLGDDTDHKIPADLADKIEWLEKEVTNNNQGLEQINKVWANFTSSEEVPDGAKYGYEFPCDREADVKAQLLDGFKNPCEAGAEALKNIATIKEEYSPSLTSETRQKEKRLKDLVEKEDARVAKLSAAWKDFLPDNKLKNGVNFEFKYCDIVNTIKAYIMDGMANKCAKGKTRLEDIAKARKKHSPDLEDEVIEKIDYLKELVEKETKELDQLNAAWKKFESSNKVAEDEKYAYEFPCDREADVKAQLLDGYKDYCTAGRPALDKIVEIMKEHKPTLSSGTKAKHSKLKSMVGKEEKNVATLNAAWKDFLPDNKLDNGINFVFEYCDIVLTIKAYIMDGITNRCAQSRQRLADIKKAREEFNPELTDDVLKKIEYLQKLVDTEDKDMEDLDAAWTMFIDNDKVSSWEEVFPEEDTIIRDEIRLVEFYCDKIAQTKSWCIKGHLDPCTKGEPFLKKIVALKKKHSLKYDKELACRVKRLESKVYQCKYWKLVLKARKITNEEREEFGPKSAETMRVDLNSAEQPCETKVVYEPIGHIGVKYVISTFMCQKINLAKMGDPLYYKKIATWVNTEVLTKYCEKSMRCKEDFFIYLEGHTDGNRFSGRSYDRSLGIAEGTPFTHFLGKSDGTVDTLKKETRQMDKKLKNNMELGIARAWTVKEQLEFMKVPIEVGAYEHPYTEKGGEFRKVDIELNITNLLLDFYEKTLNRLVKESGIGTRPKECQD